MEQETRTKWTICNYAKWYLYILMHYSTKTIPDIAIGFLLAGNGHLS